MHGTWGREGGLDPPPGKIKFPYLHSTITKNIPRILVIKSHNIALMLFNTYICKGTDNELYSHN